MKRSGAPAGFGNVCCCAIYFAPFNFSTPTLRKNRVSGSVCLIHTRSLNKTGSYLSSSAAACYSSLTYYSGPSSPSLYLSIHIVVFVCVCVFVRAVQLFLFLNFSLHFFKFWTEIIKSTIKMTCVSLFWYFILQSDNWHNWRCHRPLNSILIKKK